MEICSFMDHDFDTLSKKTLPKPTPQRFSPMFSSSSFVVLCFTFRSVSCLIFLCGLRYESKLFLFCIQISSSSSTICWKGSSFSSSWPIYLGSELLVHVSGHLLTFLLHPINLVVFLQARTTLSLSFIQPLICVGSVVTTPLSFLPLIICVIFPS